MLSLIYVLIYQAVSSLSLFRLKLWKHISYAPCVLHARTSFYFPKYIVCGRDYWRSKNTGPEFLAYLYAWIHYREECDGVGMTHRCARMCMYVCNMCNVCMCVCIVCMHVMCVYICMYIIRMDEVCMYVCMDVHLVRAWTVLRFKLQE